MARKKITLPLKHYTGSIGGFEFYESACITEIRNMPMERALKRLQAVYPQTKIEDAAENEKTSSPQVNRSGHIQNAPRSAVLNASASIYQPETEAKKRFEEAKKAEEAKKIAEVEKAEKTDNQKPPPPKGPTGPTGPKGPAEK